MKRREVKQCILKYGESTINIKGSVRSSVDATQDGITAIYEPGEGVFVTWKDNLGLHEELVPLSVISNIKFYPEERPQQPK